MARSIRVSDGLYRQASAASALQHRSLAQQVEHWAELGLVLEGSGVTTAQVEALLGADLRRRERTMLKLRLVEQERMYLLSPALARQTVVAFPELSKGSRTLSKKKAASAP